MSEHNQNRTRTGLHKLGSRYILSHPGGRSYHLMAWRRVMEDAFGHATFYLMKTDEARTVHGVLSLVFLSSRLFGRLLVSMPYVNYGGLLADTVEAQDALLKAPRDDRGCRFLQSWAREEHHVWLRGHRRHTIGRDRRRDGASIRDASSANLGVSLMCLMPISEIPAIRRAFDGSRFPAAERIADTLVTLPTHKFVSEPDRRAISHSWAGSGPGWRADKLT